MSHYRLGEPDEAQHGHYNDGYPQYDYDNNNVNPNPFDSYTSTMSDPFNQPSQSSYPPAPPPPRFAAPGPSSYNPGYDEREFTGDIPLLRSTASLIGPPEPPQIPGSYDDEEDDTQDELSTNIRYGRIPQRVPRRYKTVKKFELFHGNFVLDNPVPKKLLDMCALRNEREFTHMRYSAATCDPNDFKILVSHFVNAIMTLLVAQNSSS